MKLALFALLTLIATSSVIAQVNASSLRARYGAPLERETFEVRPGIELLVDYGPNRQACRMQLPSGAQYAGPAPAGAITRQQIDEVVEELVPLSTRGKEGNRMQMSMGMNTLSVVEYEHVRISELTAGGRGEGIIITFKDPACPARGDR
jgi:hypothetical protein